MEHPEKFYRFTLKSGKGLYQAVKEEIFRNASSFNVGRAIWTRFLEDAKINWLKRPERYPDNYESWFTEAGYKLFIKTTLPKILKHISSDMVEKIMSTNPGNILYRDEYQVFVEV